jgi:co-chaperonin GroES (HSP10)
MNSGGDVLARGAKSAQFAAGGSELSEFETDIAVGREGIEEKYGISFAELGQYIGRREAGERISLEPVANRPEVGSDLIVIDKRSTFMGQDTKVDAVAVAPKKYPDKTYGPFSPILDRILIKRCTENENMELLKDGSVKNKKTGLIIAAKYRQHSNIGVVLAAGKFVILGGQRIPMEEVVRVGDRVTYGDYNSEVFTMSEERVKSLCDAVQFNYFEDEDGLRVVRVQDVRGVEPPITAEDPLFVVCAECAQEVKPEVSDE